MAKTYIPSAVDGANLLHKYLTRWQAKLTAGMTSDQIACLGSLITSLAAFLVCVTKPADTP